AEPNDIRFLPMEHLPAVDAVNSTPALAHDAPRGSGSLVVLLPGAGDVRSENRFLAASLIAAGHRVVTADLPGHGDSPAADTYGVEQTAAAIHELIRQLGAGPAVL